MSICAISACSTTTPAHLWTGEALKAEQAHERGDLEGAQEAYDRLIPNAPTAEKRRWLDYNRAELAMDLGKNDIAVERFQNIANEDIRDETGAKASLYLAKLSGDSKAFRNTVVKYPNQSYAETAFSVWRSTLGANAPDELKRLHNDVADTEIADNVLFEAAMAVDAPRDNPDAALKLLRDLTEKYPEHAFADDAIWAAANIYMRHQRWEPAIQTLKLLTDDIESSWFVGNYASTWADDAMLAQGKIHLLHLGQYDEAVAAFNLFLETYPGSVNADDAGWYIVESSRLSGDNNAHLDALRDFVRRFDDSRFTSFARGRLGLGDPS